MKILIIGASGQIGRHIRNHAVSRGHEAEGTYCNFPLDGLVHLDAGNPGAMEDVFHAMKPIAVIYSAAMSWVDGCEQNPGLAYRENFENPRRAAELAGEIGAHFVFLSTSYVFDGVQGRYSEDDQPAPLSVYGRSKWEGERAVQSVLSDRGLILRTMGVYGEEDRRKNFVYQVIDSVRAGKVMRVPDDQFGNVTYAGDFASACLLLTERRAVGIWHLAGPEAEICRSDFARFVCGEYGLDPRWIEATPTAELHQRALRPEYGGLSIEKATSSLPWRPRRWVKIPDGD